MAFDTYDNPDNFQLGSQFFGVVQITVGTSRGEIHAAADDDEHESVARFTTGATRGQITFVDPAEAQRAANLEGTISFTWTDVKGSTDLTVTMTNAATGGWQSSVQRGAAASATLDFIAESAPAIT